MTITLFMLSEKMTNRKNHVQSVIIQTFALITVKYTDDLKGSFKINY